MSKIEQLETIVAQQAAVIEQMREALERCTKFTQEDYAALALQPCPEVLNKVRAEAVREFVKPYSDSHTYIGIAIKKEAELVAQRFINLVKVCDET